MKEAKQKKQIETKKYSEAKVKEKSLIFALKLNKLCGSETKRKENYRSETKRKEKEGSEK
jgi:hypothetical protein